MAAGHIHLKMWKIFYHEFSTRTRAEGSWEGTQGVRLGGLGISPAGRGTRPAGEIPQRFLWYGEWPQGPPLRKGNAGKSGRMRTSAPTKGKRDRLSGRTLCAPTKKENGARIHVGRAAARVAPTEKAAGYTIRRNSPADETCPLIRPFGPPSPGGRLGGRPQGPPLRVKRKQAVHGGPVRTPAPTKGKRDRLGGRTLCAPTKKENGARIHVGRAAARAAPTSETEAGGSRRADDIRPYGKT